MSETDQPRATPREITLTQATMQAVMADPDLADQMEAASEAGGTAALIEWLDAHGLSWRAGGADPGRALAESAALGGLLLDGESGHRTGEHRAQVRRKAARKAQRQARKTGRGR